MKFYTCLFLHCILITITGAQDFALEQLEHSPRHHEWVVLKVGDINLHCFVAYPEKAENTQALIVIHENRGLTDWVRSFADQLAAEGYLAIAPDLLSESHPGVARTSDFPSSDAAREAIYSLEPSFVTRALDSIYAYLQGLPSFNERVSVVGFCWGGSQSFRYATHNPALRAAMVFYGSPADSEQDLARIQCPIYGFYGENDQRINATIAPTKEKMDRLDKVYDYVIHPGAGHAFMRRGDDPEGEPENKAARDAAWERLLEILN